METIELSKIHPSKTNPRKTFEPTVLAELSDSIQRHGVLQPILVRKIEAGFEIVAGERRYRAAQAAGLKEIPATVRELTDIEVIEIQIIENLQRSDLHPLEEADGYRQLMKAKFDAAKIASRVGRSVKYVYDRIKLLNLTEPLQKEFREGKITAGHAILLARLSPKDQKKVSDKNHGGLWEDEHATFESIVGKSDGYKLRSVRELQEYIDDHVRFVPERDADPMLFPETAAILNSADPKKKSDKIVPLATGLVNPDARPNHEYHIAPTSWKRADGKKGSKTCDHSVIGVVVAGENRADAFRVCTAKEKCKTHWAEWQKDRAATKQSSPNFQENAKKEEEKRKKEEEKRQLEQKKRERDQQAKLQALQVGADAMVKKIESGKQSLQALRFSAQQCFSMANNSSKLAIRRGHKTEESLKKKIETMNFNELLGLIFECWLWEDCVDWSSCDEAVFKKHCKEFGIDGGLLIRQEINALEETAHNEDSKKVCAKKEKK